MSPFHQTQKTKVGIQSVGPMVLSLSHQGCRLTPGQTSFHERNEDVSPNPLFPLLKLIFPSCRGVKSGFVDTLHDFLADSELPFPIGSASPAAFLPTVRCTPFPI